jgi:hypothetical protein
MADYLVKVTQLVKVSLDETKFTPEFMSEFRESFYQFHDIEDHAEHIGQLVARGIHQASPYVQTEFIEGYGPISDFGISASVEDTDIEVER